MRVQQGGKREVYPRREVECFTLKQEHRQAMQQLLPVLLTKEKYAEADRLMGEVLAYAKPFYDKRMGMEQDDMRLSDQLSDAMASYEARQPGASGLSERQMRELKNNVRALGQYIEGFSAAVVTVDDLQSAVLLTESIHKLLQTIHTVKAV